MTPSEKASAILQKRRESNLINQQKRINEVYKKVPQIKSLDNQIKELGFSIIREGMKGIDTSNLEKELYKLTDYKKYLLIENGYEEDYMEIKYHHDVCKDTGFVGTKMCSCRKQLIIDENYNQSNIKKLLLKENFSKFNYSLFSDNLYQDYPITPYENIKLVNEAIYRYIENFEKETRNLYIFGEVGRGKTYLLNSIAKEMLDSNYSVLYMTSSRLFKFLNDYNWAFEEIRSKHQERYDFILECDLLIIDDLGSEAGTKNDSSNLFEVVNNRMISEKPIIFSTNFDEEMLGEMYGDRVFSRVVGNSIVFEIFGEDLRLKLRR